MVGRILTGVRMFTKDKLLVTQILTSDFIYKC